jgi:hypothetical protein
MNIRERVHNYILFMKSEADLDRILGMLVRTPSWNPHAKFLIYMEGFNDRYKQLVAYFIEQLWKKYVLDVTLLVPDPVHFVHRVRKFCIEGVAKFPTTLIDSRFSFGIHSIKAIVATNKAILWKSVCAKIAPLLPTTLLFSH